MIKTILLDLDNTLYDQNLYFSSGFKTIARYLANRFSVAEEDIVAKLWALFKLRGSTYSRLFDDLLSLLTLDGPPVVKVLVQLFRETSVDSLVLYEEVLDVLPRLARKYVLGLITNGDPGMQRRKVNALGLEQLLRLQVYTGELGCPKPSTRPYEYALELAKARPDESIYVGDNPYVDFAGARHIGMYTVRLLRGEFAGVRTTGEEIDAELRDFNEFEQWLKRLHGKFRT